MYSNIFNCFSTKSISISFNCDNCGERINEEIYDIPFPNLLSDKDTYTGTLEQSYPDIVCPKCNKDFNCIVQASNSGGEFYLNDLDENADVNFSCDEIIDDYYINTTYYDTFNNQIYNLQLMIKNLPTDPIQSDILLKMIFVNLITTMETYLSDAYITTVLNSDIYLKKYVENFYKDIKIDFCKIFDIFSTLKDNVKNKLSKVLYHRITTDVEPMYKKVLNINFKNSKHIQGLVKTRHWLVHRNGKDDNDNPIVLTQQIVLSAIDDITSFIQDIDSQLKAFNARS